MYIVRRQRGSLILEHDYCNQSQALAVAYVAAETKVWDHVMVIDTEINEAIAEFDSRSKDNAKTV